MAATRTNSAFYKAQISACFKTLLNTELINKDINEMLEGYG